MVSKAITVSGNSRTARSQFSGGNGTMKESISAIEAIGQLITGNQWAVPMTVSL